ncbi:MAG TPA: ATP-binding cassette domain-containing protein [Terriglobales bacterium]|nr:ATP-binding cassette domain-containing protein [Terriglobales bacterium]
MTSPAPAFTRQPAAAPTVALQSVRKAYGDFVAVDGLSFEIPQGSIFGLLGPNGAGKTSTIRMMIGITMPDSGEVRMFGEPFRRAHLDRIGYLPEERGLYRKMTVVDQLTLFGELHGLARAEATRRSQQWCERLDLKDWLAKRVDELSKGMQQKVQFIGALLHEPDFVIMDEPFYGLDPVNATILKDVLLEQKKAGRTILFSTHRMDQVEKLCDSMCLVNHGKPVLQGGVSEVKARWGKRNVQIDYEGDASFLRSSPLLEVFNDYGNHVEVRLKPAADPQDLLREAMQRVRVNRFELMEPSLEEIFIETVGKANA